MRTAETTAQIRSLADVELDAVNGGQLAEVLVPPTLFLIGLSIGVYWDLPLGTSVEDGKKALGMPQTDTLKPLPT